MLSNHPRLRHYCSVPPGRGAHASSSLPRLKLSLGTTSSLAHGERNGMAETRLRTHTRGTLNNPLPIWSNNPSVPPAPSGATGSGHQRHCVLSKSCFINLEGSSQTELFLSGLLLPQLFIQQQCPPTLNPLDHKGPEAVLASKPRTSLSAPASMPSLV